MELLEDVFQGNGLVVAFAAVGLVVWFSYFISNTLTNGRIHGSAIAIALGLIAAWWGGTVTGGTAGVADIGLLAGVGLMGGGTDVDALFTWMSDRAGGGLRKRDRPGRWRARWTRARTRTGSSPSPTRSASPVPE